MVAVTLDRCQDNATKSSGVGDAGDERLGEFAVGYVVPRGALEETSSTTCRCCAGSTRREYVHTPPKQGSFSIWSQWDTPAASGGAPQERVR